MAPGPLVVTFDADAKARATVVDALGEAGNAVFLADAQGEARRQMLGSAGALLARNTGTELRPEELPLIAKARLLQFMSAGVDFIPLRALPPDLPVAGNGGGYSEPMAEHGLAMALAAAKHLLVEHGKLAKGEFNQFTPTRMLAGGVCGVLGFGGIGIATARLMRGLGMRIHAISRRGTTAEPVDWIGRPDRLGELLGASDVLIVSTPLSRATKELINARALALMKPDAILVNLARGEIIDEAALYAHLEAHPDFTACIDAWWVEPIRHGRFAINQPFFDLPNLIGSPHNSSSVKGWRHVAIERAVANCRRALLGETPHHLIGDDERMA
jgi:phosphoglycerate dehydrogenase-like enzyme